MISIKIDKVTFQGTYCKSNTDLCSLFVEVINTFIMIISFILQLKYVYVYITINIVKNVIRQTFDQLS